MKKIKINFMVAAGIAVAAFTVAFTAPKEKTFFNASTETWYYTGDTMEQEELDDPENYSKTNQSGKSCNGTIIVCSIEAEESILGEPILNHGPVTVDSDFYKTTLRD